MCPPYEHATCVNRDQAHAMANPVLAPLAQDIATRNRDYLSNCKPAHWPCPHE